MRSLILILLIAVLGYAAWELYRAFRRQDGAEAPAEDQGVEAEEDFDDHLDEALEQAEAAAPQEDEIDDAGFNYAPIPRAEAAWSAPAREPAESAADPFSQTLEVSRLKGELKQMQDSLAQQRAEIAALTGTVAALRAQLDSAPAAQEVSPEYGEALGLARRGLDAEAIAEHCGITLAEAELVRTMTQREGRAGEEAL
jgi:hypothetical protein